MNTLYLIRRPKRFRFAEEAMMVLLFVCSITQVGLAFGGSAGFVRSTGPIAAPVQLAGECLAKQAHGNPPTNNGSAAFPTPAARG